MHGARQYPSHARQQVVPTGPLRAAAGPRRWRIALHGSGRMRRKPARQEERWCKDQRHRVNVCGGVANTGQLDEDETPVMMISAARGQGYRRALALVCAGVGFGASLYGCRSAPPPGSPLGAPAPPEPQTEIEAIVRDVARQAGNPPAFLASLERLRCLGEGTRALELLAPVYDQHFREERFSATLADLLLETGRLQEAVPLLAGLRRQWPESAEIAALQADLFVRTGRFDSGLMLARKAVRLAPASPRAWRALARAVAVEKLQSELRPVFDRAIALTPTDGGLLRDYGEALGRFGFADDAVRVLKQALTLRPSDPATLGQLALQTARHASTPELRSDAVQLLRRAVDLAPTATEPLFQLGRLLQQQGESQEAIAVLEQCLRIDSTFHDVWLPLGQAYQARGRQMEARRAFANYRTYSDYRREAAHLNQRLRRAPADVTLLLRMARVQELYGHRAAAIRYYRDALRLRRDLGVAERLRVLEADETATGSG